MGNHIVVPLPAMLSWIRWVNASHKSIHNYDLAMTKIKQAQKPCAYFMDTVPYPPLDLTAAMLTSWPWEMYKIFINLILDDFCWYILCIFCEIVL